jgi:hypothetical protein
VIPRRLQGKLRAAARRFPVVTLTGPRQSGKTTLCRAAFPRHAYVSLEAPDTREYATADPRGFLEDLRAGAVLDEIQRAPELLSYLQEEVDARPRAGRFVLSGSANLALLAGVSQSLAGRTAVLRLLPCAYDELKHFANAPEDLWETLWSGSFPAVFDRRVPAADWFDAYIATYVERDVRQVLKVTDLGAFQTFLRLCAGRVGQLLNLSSLGADCGVTHNTAKAWVSLLEASFVAQRLQPWHANLGKRLVKTPKLYFLDCGLVCALLGIRSAAQLREHPLRGAIFENWVYLEILKARFHRGLPADLFFFRSRQGLEVDFVVDAGALLIAVEAKSGRTVASDFFAALGVFRELIGGATTHPSLRSVLIHGGESSQRRGDVIVAPWKKSAALAWW